MQLDNAQLAAFAMVLAEGSFEAAARRLHVTPSAVSQRIRQLEERLGQVLLQRTTPCRPTAAGKMLERFTQQLAVLEAEALADIAGQACPAPHLRVPLAVNADSLDGWFLDVFAAMPSGASIGFDIRVEDQDHSAALLREGTVMAAVSASAQPVQGCVVEPLGTMRYLGVASPDFMRTHFADGVDATSLARAPMLAYNRKDALQQRFAALLCGQALQPPTHYVPSALGFVGVARRSLGWGMLPESFVGAALGTGELVELVPGRYLDVPLFWHRWRLNAAVLDTLSAAVRDAALRALRQDAPA